MCFKTLKVAELGVSMWEPTRKRRLRQDETYCVIFGAFQDPYVEKFKREYEKDITILHEDKAVNGSQQHPRDATLRQHVIIFEKKK